MMKAFEKEYWQTNYSDLKTIDGIGNVKDHSRYVAAYFNLEGFEVESLIDLGFGMGRLLKEFNRVLKPRRVAGIEPSEFIYKKMKLPGAKLRQMDLLSWAQDPKEKWVYDLAILNSVLQYIPNKDLKFILPILSRRTRYLYLTVPTEIEYERQSSELSFKDDWAIIRSQKEYLQLLRPHFTFISSRMLESKHFYTPESTPFQDLLFRF
jgi:hypothetical protein